MTDWRFILLAAALLPIVIGLVFVGAITLSFAKLGLAPETALLVFWGSLVGGLVNIPVWRRRIQRPSLESWNPIWPWHLWGRRLAGAWGDEVPPFGMLFYRPPVVRAQIVAVNLGGALIPLALSIYLLPRAPLGPLLAATAGVAALCYVFAKPAWPFGIVLPAFLPPIAAALFALFFAPEMAPPVAYVAGTIGTVVGADLLHLSDLQRYDTQVLSIGGAGIHDGIFLAGFVAVLLA